MLIACPFCGFQKFFKAGFRVTRTGKKIQRYLCRACRRRFSLHDNSKMKLNVHRSEDIVPYGSVKEAEGLLSLVLCNRDGREGRSEKVLPTSEEDMNLANDEAMSVLVQEPGPAQDSKDKELEGALIGFAWHLKKQGLRESTVKEYCKILRQLARSGVNLEDPEAVKEALAKSNRSGEWKALMAHAYSAYLKAKGKHWDPPRFEVARKIPFIPLESELDALIAGCGPKTATLLQLLKETGMRIGEALRLTWSSIDMERRVIVLNQPEKNSNPRIFKISPRLVGMLNMLPKDGERVFPASYESVKNNFKNSRRRLAERLNNPRLLNIGFHTFRHWKATMEYHKTKDLLHVKELLGHKNVDNTMLYIQIERTLFSETDAEFTVRVAKTPDEVKELLEAGFEYVCEKDGLMFFRKRK